MKKSKKKNSFLSVKEKRRLQHEIFLLWMFISDEGLLDDVKCFLERYGNDWFPFEETAFEGSDTVLPF